MEEQILRYLALFAKYPQSEYLSKCGLSAFIQSYLERYPVTRGLLNWRGKSLRKVLGFQPAKQELRYIVKTNLSGVTLAAWLALRKNGCPVLLPDLAAYGWLTETSVLKELHEAVPFDKLFTYQKRLEKRGELTAYFFRDYLDYVRECRQLGYDMSRKEILFPNKLAEKHIQNQRRIKHKRDRQLDQKILERYPQLVEKYKYAAHNFCIVVPKNSGDLIAEGHYLRHCVGNYIDRYANGFTDIVFLRKAADPAASYYTLEIYDGDILQCRGIKNCSPTEEIYAFLDEFKQHRLTKKRKKRAV
ncbi:PcfJ domain-containing protein [Acetonema longum]|uniref:PcfJ domain-containing protein n=1 Tax=Acetonema longum TaxID=2374 RepID=UPI00031C87D8|nr:PcfJ domain-containing protein [Acetonema longum]